MQQAIVNPLLGYGKDRAKRKKLIAQTDWDLKVCRRTLVLGYENGLTSFSCFLFNRV